MEMHILRDFTSFKCPLLSGSKEVGRDALANSNKTMIYASHLKGLA